MILYDKFCLLLCIVKKNFGGEISLSVVTHVWPGIIRVNTSTDYTNTYFLFIERLKKKIPNKFIRLWFTHYFNCCF